MKETKWKTLRKEALVYQDGKCVGQIDLWLYSDEEWRWEVHDCHKMDLDPRTRLKKGSTRGCLRTAEMEAVAAHAELISTPRACKACGRAYD